ncbi:unnamed protein product [Hydatigera taeniaeformis]|uniref:Uncharacterized protein n=1 Tax=Hydatigena taeniaeformis TaxID=6205 RepID=A0A0R3X2X5_HYDTA|nr:unnamed protein product [Hydatigera taeniaeformis]
MGGGNLAVVSNLPAMPNKSSATNFLLKSGNQGSESRQTVTTLVAASVDIPPFKEGTDFDDWLFFTKADLELYELAPCPATPRLAL